jgi:DNA-binding response OmpR family regulator
MADYSRTIHLALGNRLNRPKLVAPPVAFDLATSTLTSVQTARQMNPRILFVDDEANMRELLSLYLRHEGMEVTAVATGPQAKELFSQAPFDLTILDLRLAGVDSWDVLNFIKHNDSKHPVIIYSGLDENELVQKKDFLGRADAVVRKMSPLASLLAEIRQHLPKSSSTGEAHSEPVPRS